MSEPVGWDIGEREGHYAFWLMPVARGGARGVDPFGSGALMCGALDEGVPRSAPHVTLATFDGTEDEARAKLAQLGRGLLAALGVASEGTDLAATITACATSPLARMRTYLALDFRAGDPLSAAARMLGQAAPTIPAHLTLSYHAEHPGLVVRDKTLAFDALWLVDLGPGAVLDVTKWRHIDTARLVHNPRAL